MKTSYRQLNLEEREKIAILRAQGQSIRKIAKDLARSHSTILRELDRNSAPVNKGYYLPSGAHERALISRRKRGRKKKFKNDFLRNYVESKLQIGWSPEQIAGKMIIDHLDFSISHESIYQYIYSAAPHLRGYLTRRHRKRLPKRHSRKHQRSHIPNRVAIDVRPSLINQRIRFGHWESDSIEAARGDKFCLNILVERKSRLVQISKMQDHSPRSTRQSIQARLGIFPKQARRSITYDNGFENLQHEKVNQTLGIKSYFCNPFHSWEKGTVENTIGLVRRFIPKGTEIYPLQKRFIRKIESLLNNRPRKCLGFRTPLELFNKFGGALTP